VTLAVLAALSLSLALQQQIDSRSMRIAVAPAETLQVTVTGVGKPVVIVPGIWSNTFAFRKVVPPLAAQSFSVIVIEPLGVAASSRPRHADYSMTAQAQRIRAVLDTLRINRAVFVGQALSSSMLMRLIVNSPGRVEALVSLEGGAAEQSATPGLKAGLAFGAVVLRIVPSTALIRRRLRSDFRNVSGDKSWITDDVVNAYMRAWSRDLRGTIGAYRSIANSTEPGRISTRLGQVTVPVRLLTGAAPHYGGVSPRELEPMQRLIRDFRIDRIPGAGHLLHEERPDVVVSAILDVVRPSVTPSPSKSVPSTSTADVINGTWRPK
jgi:magnesium chelatase accessory protein